MMDTPEEYMKAIDVLRDAIVESARKNWAIMVNYETAVIHSGLTFKKRFTVAQQQVAYREARKKLLMGEGQHVQVS